MSSTRPQSFDLRQHYETHLGGLWRQTPFVLRSTEWQAFPVPVLVVKKRLHGRETPPASAALSEVSERASSQGGLVERGHLAGAAQRRCLPILRQLVGQVRSAYGVPLELQRYLTQEGLRLRVNLPLDEEAGAKLSVIFRLQERLADLDRTELIARRVARFTREEALYWLSRMTSFGADANRWAIAGLRLMLGGQANDPTVQRLLERLR